MVIERPWEESFCEKCTRCVQEDMCNAYMFGMSYAFCPQIRDCERFKERKQTNADRIRAMSDEELAVFLRTVEYDVEQFPFIQDWDKWLKQPAEE